MNSAVIILLACLVGVAVSEPLRQPDRIVGGQLTTVNQYPYSTCMLFASSGSLFRHRCGGTIINNRSVLSAAHCTIWRIASEFRLRIGSSFAHSEGTVLSVSQLINHPQYNSWTLDNDVSILRTSTPIVYFPNVIQPATIASSNYFLADNSPVWSIGWGTTQWLGQASEQLRHVQIWTVNQEVCRQRYATRNEVVTDNMMCSGWLDVGGRDACQGDSGGPLIHNNVIVGVCSWGYQCAHPFFPGVHARVSRYTTWIQANA